MGFESSLVKLRSRCEISVRGFDPLDTMNYIPQGVNGVAHFLLGRHEEALAAMRRALQLNPGFSILHGWLAAALAKLGHLDEARAAGARLLTFDPGFSINGWCAAVGFAPHVKDVMRDGLRQAYPNSGFILPEQGLCRLILINVASFTVLQDPEIRGLIS